MALLFLTSEARHIKKTRARYNARMPSLIEKIMQRLPGSGQLGEMCWDTHGDGDFWYCPDDQWCDDQCYSGCSTDNGDCGDF